MSDEAAEVSPGFRQVDLDDIRAALGEPAEPVLTKIHRSLGPTDLRFIAHSPFICLATSSSAGADASPRGDGPGFVKALDATTLAVPDRSGNALCDSFRNILEDPKVGMLFLVPGLRETLRVNGTGYITDDPGLRGRFELDGHVPKLVLVVEVAEVYFHCGKSLIRSRLWDPASTAIAEHVTFGSSVFAMSKVEVQAVDGGTLGEFGEMVERGYVNDL